MNPSSGRSSNQEAIDFINGLGEAGNLPLKIYFTTGNGDATAIRKEIEEFRPGRVVACGGDGTIQLVAGCIIDSGLPLGIIPLGSANGLATALNLPRDFRDAIRLVTEGQDLIPLDLLRINEDYICTHLSDVGTNALLVKNFEESGDKGMLGYAKHLLSSIQQSDVMHFDIHTPEGNFTKVGYMLTIANAHKYGTGVQISEGSVSDGRFEICNVQKIDIETAIKAGLTALNVFIDKDMFSDVISCKQARIRIIPGAHLQIDGEYIGEVDELRVNILSAALKVVVP